MSSFDSRNDFGARSTASAPASNPTACPACRSTSIGTTAKSPNPESYWRCASCGEVWNAGRRHDARRPANAWR